MILFPGGEVTFDLKNDAPTLTGARATFNINLNFPPNQTVLSDGQVVWARNCTINGESTFLLTALALWRGSISANFVWICKFWWNHQNATFYKCTRPQVIISNYEWVVKHFFNHRCTSIELLSLKQISFFSINTYHYDEKSLLKPLVIYSLVLNMTSL